MQVLLFLLAIVFVSSCLVQNNKSRTKTIIEEEPLKSFDNCIANMHSKKDFFVGPSTDRDLRVLELRLHSCIIYIGHRQDNTNSFLRHMSQLRNMDEIYFHAHNPGSRVSKYNGNYLMVKKFMDINRITCEKFVHKEDGYDILRFKFPTKDIGHEDYRHVKVECHKKAKTPKYTKYTRINISLKNPQSTSPTMSFDMAFNEESRAYNALYHFLDTDRDGVIKRHVKVRGQTDKERAILDNYELVNQ